MLITAKNKIMSFRLYSRACKTWISFRNVLADKLYFQEASRGRLSQSIGLLLFAGPDDSLCNNDLCRLKDHKAGKHIHYFCYIHWPEKVRIFHRLCSQYYRYTSSYRLHLSSASPARHCLPQYLFRLRKSSLFYGNIHEREEIGGYSHDTNINPGVLISLFGR